MITHSPKTRLVVLFSACALLLSGCGTTTPTTSKTATAGSSVSISDAWVKAADSGMSAAFGELKNDSDHDVNIVSAKSPASSSLQLHETVANSSGEMVMQEKKGGFVIPAKGTFTLEPGGNHIMLMDVTQALKAGDDASFTLTFSDGSTFTFDAPVKDYTGANENYEGGSDMKMDMSATPSK